MYLFELLYQYFEEHYFSASLGENYEHFDFAKTSTTLLMIIGGLCLGMLIASVLAVIQKKHVGKLARALLAAEAHDEKSAKSLAELGLDKSIFVKLELSRASALRKLLGIVEGDKSFTYLDELAEAFPAYAAKAAEEKKKNEAKVNKKKEAEQADTADTVGESVGEASSEAISEASESVDPSAPADGEAAKDTVTDGSRSRGGARDFFLEKRFRVKKLDYATARFFIPEVMRYRAEFRFKEKGNSWWGVLIGALVLIAVFLLCLRFIPMFVRMLDLSIDNIVGN